jgi:hypothetical protein
MLQPSKVAEIKRDICDPKLTQKQIAARHGVSRSLVSDIATERCHKEVPWPKDRLRKQSGGQHKPIPEYDPTNVRILELEAEVAHLTEERNRERKRVKAGAKERGIFKSMVAALEEQLPKMQALPPTRRKLTGTSRIDEHVVMHLSDGHHDSIVVPEECGGLESYDFNVSCRRAERYVDTVVDWTQNTLRPNFTFSDLWILAYGDFTSGEIHGHAQRSYFRNMMKNCLAIGQLHALMFRDLAPYFKRVHVVYVPGNHGRRSEKKNHHGAHDNWDFLVAKIAELRCGDIKNIDFLIPDAFSVNLNINGVGFHIFHGDDIRGSMGLPYYGLQRRQRSLIALGNKNDGPRIRYFCCGHFHKPGSVGDMDGEILVNGPWLGTDAYSYNSFAGYTEPSQWLHGVNPKYGITWRMDVKLRAPGPEIPQRYKITDGRVLVPS